MEPASCAVAVKVTWVLQLYAAEQVLPQSIPDGELVTFPEPSPLFVTVRACWPTQRGVKVAVTLFAAPMVTVQVPVVFVQAPDQPVKEESAEG